MGVDTSLHGEDFREHIKQFIEQILPDDLREDLATAYRARRDSLARWQRILDDNGLLLVGWPVEYGGTEMSGEQQSVLGQELVRAGAPVLDIPSLRMIGPILYTYGTDAQKKEYLPKIKRTEIWWCQGFSEPNAGSDLFSLTTRIDSDGSDYIVNGRKIWTSRAHWADMMFAIVRGPTELNDPDAFSFILIDMRSPGMTVRPIRSLENGHHLNEVFLEDVRIPKSNLVGAEGQGKEITRFLLTLERFNQQVTEEVRKRLAKVEKQLAVFTGSPAERHALERRLRFAEVDCLVLEAVVSRLGTGLPDKSDHALASSVKLISSELEQTATELTVDALGVEALENFRGEDGLGEPIELSEPQVAMMDYLFLRAASIYAGSNEVQRNIVFRQISR